MRVALELMFHSRGAFMNYSTARSSEAQLGLFAQGGGSAMVRRCHTHYAYLTAVLVAGRLPASIMKSRLGQFSNQILLHRACIAVASPACNCAHYGCVSVI